MSLTLSVLVSTVPSRASSLAGLLAVLRHQAQGLPVEIQTLLDDGTLSIGTKRNRLIASASGQWLCFVDDDDMVADGYLSDIMAALVLDPDCVTFLGRFSIDGEVKYDWRYRLGRGEERDPDGVWGMRPNHLCPVRSSIARATPFPDIRAGEDRRWAVALMPKLRPESVVHIDKILYHYRLSTSGSLTPTGMARGGSSLLL